MSHLVCTEHGRRVVVVNKKVIHRSDQGKCDSKILKAGGNKISSAAVDPEFLHHSKEK